MIKSTKRIGIWMDHATAHLMTLADDLITTEIIGSKANFQEKHAALEKSEVTMHHKEQREEHSFYKEISKALLSFDEVLLFGPTGAKNELFNILKSDHHFDKVKIEVEAAGKMTENQEHAFVKNYFK